MPIQVDDRVRTATGQLGRVVIINDEGTFAFVQFDERPDGAHLTLHELSALAKVMEERE